jgi:hypothetical protein
LNAGRESKLQPQPHGATSVPSLLLLLLVLVSDNEEKKFLHGIVDTSRSS